MTDAVLATEPANTSPNPLYTVPGGSQLPAVPLPNAVPPFLGQGGPANTQTVAALAPTGTLKLSTPLQGGATTILAQLATGQVSMANIP